MIASRGRDYSAFFLLRGQLRERIACAAFFEASGALQVVQLAKNLHAGELTQRDRCPTGRVVDCPLDSFPSSLDITKRDHAVAYTALETAAMFSARRLVLNA